jgi:hypothetical protein
MATIKQMSTVGVPPRERLSFWNDSCMGAYGAMVVDTEPDGFEGVLTLFSAGQLNAVSMTSATSAACSGVDSDSRRVPIDRASAQSQSTGFSRPVSVQVKIAALSSKYCQEVTATLAVD